LHFLLLPFVEEDVMYKQSLMPTATIGHGVPGNYNMRTLYNPAWAVGGPNDGGPNPGPVYGHKVPIYLCPSDGTLPGDGRSLVWNDLINNTGNQDVTNLGLYCSYSPNQQVFGRVDAAGLYVSPEGNAVIPGTFKDGTSKTIILAEKLPRCSENDSLNSCSLWNKEDDGGASNPSDVLPYHPYFAVSSTSNVNGSIALRTTNIGPTSVFLNQPSPVTIPGTSLGIYPYKAGTGCDPGRASTPHTAGMQVALGDGSVRTLAPNMSGLTWWAACTPAGTDTIGDDW